MSAGTREDSSILQADGTVLVVSEPQEKDHRRTVSNPKQNEAQGVRAESTHKGTLLALERQTQQQRPESPTLTLTWHVCKYKVHKLHQRYILAQTVFRCPQKQKQKIVSDYRH